jgi:hypothetical protein
VSSKIFIPKTCRVGFQERSDTFTNQIGLRYFTTDHVENCGKKPAGLMDGANARSMNGSWMRTENENISTM